MKDFIYFVDLDSFLVCLNLASTNAITSPSIMYREQFQKDHPVYEVDLDQMLTDPDSLSASFISPRMESVILSYWNNHGLKIGIGLQDPKWMSEEQIGKINRLAEVEIAFEKGRRQIDSSLPSRLTCIYLAEKNIKGKIMLQHTFPDKRNFTIVPVRINHFDRLHKADSKWILEYKNTRDISAIESYWRGAIFDEQPEYEYLVDGQVELIDIADREHIRQYGAMK